MCPVLVDRRVGGRSSLSGGADDDSYTGILYGWNRLLWVFWGKTKTIYIYICTDIVKSDQLYMAIYECGLMVHEIYTRYADACMKLKVYEEKNWMSRSVTCSTLFVRNRIQGSERKFKCIYAFLAGYGN